jgi:hypothetical protein
MQAKTKTVRLLHIIDDRKFIPCCIETFNLEFLHNNFLNSSDLSTVQLFDYDMLFIHQLGPNAIDFLSALKYRIPIVWFFWGSDGFCLGKFHNRFLLSQSKKLRLRLSFQEGILSGISNLLVAVFPRLKDLRPYNIKLLRAMKNVDVIVPVIPKDFELLASEYKISARCFHMNYINGIFNEDVYGQSCKPQLNEKKILLGNSASLTNNHFEALDYLSRFDLNGRKVVIPLSYGDKKYAEIVRKRANRMLPQQSICLTDFLPFAEYNKILSDCDIVVMFHRRQQALGNVLQSIFSGANVYLLESNPLFSFFNSNGFNVSLINEMPLKPLVEEQKEHNRRLCYKFFGRKTQHIKVRQLICSRLKLQDKQ